MRKIGRVRALFRNFELFEIGATVLSESTRSDVKYGTGPHMTTRTVIDQYQTLYLTDEDDGVERSIELADFHVPCRPGHRITLRGVDGQCWFEAFNHDLDRSFESRTTLTQYVIPNVLFPLTAILVAALAICAVNLWGWSFMLANPIHTILGGIVLAGLVMMLVLMLLHSLAALRVGAIRRALRRARKTRQA